MKEGTIIKERTKFNPLKIRTYLSACIRFFNKTTHNHVAIVLYIEGEPYVFEAWKRVQCTSLIYWFRVENDYNEIPPDEDLDIKYAKFAAMQMIGRTEYNYFNTMFFQLIYQLSGCRWWLGPSGDKANKKVQCAQFLAILLKKDKPWLWNPKDF